MRDEALLDFWIVGDVVGRVVDEGFVVAVGGGVGEPAGISRANSREALS